MWTASLRPQHPVQYIQKPRPIRLTKHLPPALPERVRRPQIRHQVAGRQHHPDAGPRQLHPVMLQNPRPRLQTARGQREYPPSPPHRQHRTARQSTCPPHPARPPQRRDSHQRVRRGPDAPVRHQHHLDAQPRSHPLCLSLHRAGIGVDIQRHPRSPMQSPGMEINMLFHEGAHEEVAVVIPLLHPETTPAAAAPPSPPPVPPAATAPETGPTCPDQSGSARQTRASSSAGSRHKPPKAPHRRPDRR